VAGSPKGDQPTEKMLLVIMFKYAVFDIKPTYNNSIFIPYVQLHLPKISSGWPDLY